MFKVSFLMTLSIAKLFKNSSHFIYFTVFQYNIILFIKSTQVHVFHHEMQI